MGIHCFVTQEIETTAALIPHQQVVIEALVASQNAMRSQQDAAQFVSLRDAKRCLSILQFCARLYQRLNDGDGDADQSQGVETAIFVALHIAYESRLDTIERRRVYRQQVTEHMAAITQSKATIWIHSNVL